MTQIPSIGTSSTTAAGASSTTAAGGSSTTTSGSTGSSSELNQLSNPQLFLQLLIAELQNQDPTNPLNPSTILQQTSELSSVEATQTMTSEMGDEQATGLIGKTVTASLSGSEVSGTVTAVNLSTSGSPTITVSGQANPIALSDITEVSEATSS